MSNLIIDINKKPEEQEDFPHDLIKKSLVLMDKDNTGYFYLPTIEVLRYMGYNYKDNYFWFLTEIVEVQFSLEEGELNDLVSYYKEHRFDNPFLMGIGLLEIRDEQCERINKEMDYYLSYFNKPRDLIADYKTHSENFLNKLKQHIEANKDVYILKEAENETEIEG